ncbi:H-NS family nucleoid-associated regulatory protein [Ralstonia thomasii]|uniref:H-NS histone family protein n=1 Tax=Ralstonia thomasii TaxID=3058596 RepID=UPI003C2CA0ED
MPSYSDLVAQIKELQKQADAMRSAERDAVIKDIREKIEAYEISPTQLGFKLSGAAAGKKVPVRYKDDNGNTWTGRGIQPGWLKAELQKGKQLTDFLVP